MVYQAAEDLKFDKTLKTIRKELEQDRGSFVFDPDDFKEEAATFDVESYRLPKEGLLEYGRLATRLRKQFQEKADAAKALQVALSKPDEEAKDFVVPKLYRGYEKKPRVKEPVDLMLGFEARYPSRRYKKRKKTELRTSELQEILRLVREEGTSQRDVAELFNVKPAFVTSLVKNEKLKNNSVVQLQAKQED